MRSLMSFNKRAKCVLLPTTTYRILPTIPENSLMTLYGHFTTPTQGSHLFVLYQFSLVPLKAS